jgi:hypothetical protein
MNARTVHAVLFDEARRLKRVRFVTNQMKIPRLCEAHLGPLALQSAHVSM